jgi:hypothetical protein
MQRDKLAELIKQCFQEMLEEEGGNTTGAVGGYLGKFAFKKAPKMKPLEEKMGALGPHAFRKPKPQNAVSKTGFEDIPNLDLHMEAVKENNEEETDELTESRYSQFKNKAKTRSPKEQLHIGIKEIQIKLDEINRLVDFATRMKTELKGDATEIEFLKRTHNSLFKINEKITQMNDKIKGLTT